MDNKDLNSKNYQERKEKVDKLNEKIISNCNKHITEMNGILFDILSELPKNKNNRELKETYKLMINAINKALILIDIIKDANPFMLYWQVDYNRDLYIWQVEDKYIDVMLSKKDPTFRWLVDDSIQICTNIYKPQDIAYTLVSIYDSILYDNMQKQQEKK